MSSQTTESTIEVDYTLVSKKKNNNRKKNNYGFAQIFFCHCPKNLNFAQILETWREFPPFPPGRHGYA